MLEVGEPSPDESMTDSIEREGERMERRVRDSNQTLMGEEGSEEYDLRVVVGRTDDLLVEREDDMERQYLGRWTGGTER